ncbi:MAG: pitrilysin family protein [Deltaproteobacteria bacterium]|nr:pitrilysin family protein [Deltaproteobacteria bacterium]
MASSESNQPMLACPQPRPHLRRATPAHASVALCAALLALGSYAPNASAQVLPATPTVDTLPNGLRVVVLPLNSPGLAAWDVLVRTGARDEIEPGHSGFAHLFEHMMFRGTERMSAHAYEHHMQSLGADNNAYTTEDFTLYTVTLPSRALAQLIPVEADRFQHLHYDEPTFQTETRAVLGEYNKNSANPVRAMWEVLSETAFTQHTYSHTTLGYLADIEAMPTMYTYSQQFFRRFYTPDNCTIIVAGDVQREAVLALVTQHFGAWSGHRDNPTIAVEPAQTAPRRRDLVWPSATTPRVLVGYRVPAFSLANRDSAALEVLGALAFSESSPLYQQWVVRDQRLLGLESWKAEVHRDPGLFVVDARMGASPDPNALESAIQATLDELGRTPPEAARVAAVVSNLRYSLPMSAQTPSASAEMIARWMAVTGDVAAYDTLYRTLAEVTPADVQRVASQILTTAHRTTIALYPAGTAPAGARLVGPGAPRRVVEAPGVTPTPPRAPAARRPTTRRAGGAR